MGFRFRPDPMIENQLSEEARLLMEEEGQGWHPPQTLPNTPRDPEIEAKKRRAMEVLLKNKQAQSPILPSQNPFAERVPSPQEMAMTSAAVRHAQTPATPAAVTNNQFKDYPDDFAPSQTEMDRNNPYAPTIERAGKELDVDRPSDLPGGEDNPKEPAPEDLISQPGQSLARQALNQYMLGDDEEKDTRIPTFSDEYMKSMAGAGSTNRNIALMALMAKSSAQMGAVGGKVADTSGFDGFANQAIQGNNDSMKYITNMEMEQLKAQNKASSKADKTKLLLALANYDQKDAQFQQSDATRRESNRIQGDLRRDSIKLQEQIAGVSAADRDADRIQRGTLASGAQTLQGLSLEETKRANKAREELAKTESERKKAADKARAHGTTEGVRKARVFLDMMDRAAKQFDKLEQNYDASDLKDRIGASTGILGKNIMSDNAKLAQQYEAEFIRAKLRFESGASISIPEFAGDASTFFPRAGDTKEVLAQKRLARQNVLDAFKGAYSEKMTPMKEYEAAYGEEGQGAAAPAASTVTVLWKGRPKVIAADRLVEALELGAKEMGK